MQNLEKKWKISPMSYVSDFLSVKNFGVLLDATTSKMK